MSNNQNWRFNPECDGKTPYDSPQQANRVARRMENRKNGRCDMPHVYKCPFCKSWHVGGTIKHKITRR